MPTSETLTNEKRRAGLEFSSRVAALASAAPDISTKRMLNKVVHSIRKRYGYSDTEKESEILKCIRNGAATIRDLMEETGFPSPEVSTITRRLADQNRIRFERLSITRKGRPAILIFEIEEI
jgi:hypothetical protein